MRVRYYPHEKLLKSNGLKISDLPIELQDQIKIWRANKEKGYHSKYVPQSEVIGRKIEKFIEDDIDSLYEDVPKMNHSKIQAIRTENAPQIAEQPQDVAKNVSKAYHSNTIGFSSSQPTGDNQESHIETEKQVETPKILNSSDTEGILVENEPQKATDTEKDIEKASIPNHSEINSDFEKNKPNEPKVLEQNTKNVSTPNHSEKKGVLVKVEKPTLPQKVTVLCPTFCKKIGKTEMACYNIMKAAEQEGIEPIIGIDDLPSFGIKTGFWNGFTKLSGFKGQFFQIKRIRNSYALSYEVIALEPLPSEAFTEIEESQLISDGAKEEKPKEFDLSDLKSINELISNKASDIVNESKFYDTLNSVEKVFYDIVKKASEATEKPLKHVNTTLSELKEKGINKLRKNDLISQHFKITPLKEKGTFRITRK